MDPTLTVSLPAGVTAETGLDALTHAVEAYIGRFYNTRETRSLSLIHIYGKQREAYHDHIAEEIAFLLFVHTILLYYPQIRCV